MIAGLPILTAEAMRRAEQAACDDGLDEYVLMERAGAAAAEIIWRAGHRRDLLILCGPGNNGGDGFVIGRILRERGLSVRIAALDDSRTVSASRARAAWNGPVEDFADARPATQLVDALFGTGLSRGLDAPVAQQLAYLVDRAQHSYAIDLPSGVGTDDGGLLSAVPRFGVTIALGALKPAHMLYPAAAHMGRVVCADIGIAAESPVRALMRPDLSVPAWGAHKYNRGLVAVVGGAMAGAAMLAASAAARSGAGAVRRLDMQQLSAPPHAIVDMVVADDAKLAQALGDRRISTLLIGPGLGRDAIAKARLHEALRADLPLVLDADALTLLAGPPRAHFRPGAILTPHEGEFVRLFGDLPGSKIDRARAAAQLAGGVVIYKGADSVVAAPDGRVAVAGGMPTWLSTAGTGDVLAGLVAGRYAVTGDPFRAACEAVWLHGEAAHRAGPAFVADDLLGALSAAIGSRL